MSALGYILMMIVVGGLIPIQGGINSSLSRYLSHPLQATVFNFFGGLVLLFLLSLVMRFSFLVDTPWSKIPWIYFTGGAFGVIFVTSGVLIIPKIGAANFLAAAVTGQMCFAILMDHFGWLNFPLHPVSGVRLLGVLMLLMAVYLIQRY